MEWQQKFTGCFTQIEQQLGQDGVKLFLDCEYTKLNRFHFGLGQWIRNNLLTESGPLLYFFKTVGIEGRDDMSDFILKSFYIFEKIKSIL